MASNDHASLDAHIAALRELGEMPERIAPRVADAIDDEIAGQIDRGQGPDGKAWKLTAEGKVPLRGAARAVSTRAVGSSVVIRVTGHHARHHLGAVKGRVKREIIPTQAIPAPIARAIGRVADEDFERVMGAGP